MQNRDIVRGFLGKPFPALSSEFDEEFYNNHTVRLTQLLDLENHLNPLSALHSKVVIVLKKHDPLLADRAVYDAFQNMCCLQKEVIHLKNSTETTFYKVLDSYPSRTESQLRYMVKEVSFIDLECLLSDNHSISQISHKELLLEGKLPNISFLNFKTLGARQWLDDEIINYFVTKWCSRSSTTLGLSTFFACKILFQDNDNSCVHAKRGILTVDDERKALKWCHRAEVSCGHFI